MLGLKLKRGPGAGVLYLYARDRGLIYHMEDKTEQTKTSGHRCRYVSVYVGQGTDGIIVFGLLSNLYYKRHQTQKLKCFSSRLVVVFEQSTGARASIN